MYLLFILAALGLCCCTRAFSSCGEQGLLFAAVCVLLVAVAHCAEVAFKATRLEEISEAVGINRVKYLLSE